MLDCSLWACFFCLGQETKKTVEKPSDTVSRFGLAVRR